MCVWTPTLYAEFVHTGIFMQTVSDVLKRIRLYLEVDGFRFYDFENCERFSDLFDTTCDDTVFPSTREILE